MPAVQARYWILTIPEDAFTPYLPVDFAYIRGQLEIGEGGFRHWQIIAYSKSQVSRSVVRLTFGPYHCEPTKSKAAENYVWKEETAVPDTRFEFGVKSIKRFSPKDWEATLLACKQGDWDKVPPDVLIRCYSNLKRIHVDNLSKLININIRTCRS